MIKIENVSTAGWEPAIRGMRNPMNSWNKSDSEWKRTGMQPASEKYANWKYVIGPNDLDLAKRLCRTGSDHRKFLRMIVCYADITAPLYWHKEMDTYRFGVEKNSCSTMHCIHKHEFALDDFSTEQLYDDVRVNPFNAIIDCLNFFRELYLQEKDKDDWSQLIQLLPSSYNQKRTYMMSYESLRNMYHARKNHKLKEWRNFCEWVETLPYSELITE